MHVKINGKVYDGIDEYSTSKLEKLSMLAQQDIDAYKGSFNHPLKASQLAQLKKLQAQKDRIDSLIAESRM